MLTTAQDKVDREDLLLATKLLFAKGLNAGRQGNASVRTNPETFLITPSGQGESSLRESAMVRVNMDGEPERLQLKPSTEWRIHRDIYQARPNVHCIVHTHSIYSTLVSCVNSDIPPIHYEVAFFGGHHIPVADYALFGTEQLSKNVVEVLGAKMMGCLMEKHGALTLGYRVVDTVELAEKLEWLARLFWELLRDYEQDEMPKLKPSQMDEVLAAFDTYARKPWLDRPSG